MKTTQWHKGGSKGSGRATDHGRQLFCLQGGFTLIELLVVLAIVGILVIAMGFELVGWKGKYNAEADIKRLYTELSNARSRSIQTKRVYFMKIPASEKNTFYIYKDDDPTPDGDGELTVGSDSEFKNAVLLNNILAQVRDLGFTRSGIAFNSSGIIKTPKWIRVVDPEGEDLYADIDCLEIISTRVNLGQFDEDTNKCETK